VSSQHFCGTTSKKIFTSTLDHAGQTMPRGVARSGFSGGEDEELKRGLGEWCVVDVKEERRGRGGREEDISTGGTGGWRVYDVCVCVCGGGWVVWVGGISRRG